MNLTGIVDRILYFFYQCNTYEEKLLRYQGYRPNSVKVWKNQLGFSWGMTRKVLEKLEILDAPRIRSIFTEVVYQHQAVFSHEHCFITSFGEEGKSGNKVIYEFRHANLVKGGRIVKSWELPRLPEKSIIVFVDDLIGTGTQSVDFISKRLNLMLNPSHEAILLTLCATPEGIEHVQENTNFKVITGMVLEKSKYQHYEKECGYFSEHERDYIIKANARLKKQTSINHDKGLLLAFYYSVPNNTMPIVWKEKYEYENERGEKKQWFALLPRQF